MQIFVKTLTGNTITSKTSCPTPSIMSKSAFHLLHMPSSPLPPSFHHLQLNLLLYCTVFLLAVRQCKYIELVILIALLRNPRNSSMLGAVDASLIPSHHYLQNILHVNNCYAPKVSPQKPKTCSLECWTGCDQQEGTKSKATDL